MASSPYTRDYDDYIESVEPTKSNTTTNFMEGKSFTLHPLQSLKVVCTSMICGESQYYRNSEKQKNPTNDKFVEHFVFPEFYTESSTDYFEKIVSDALNYDFEGCLRFVSKLRNEYYMRLNSNYLLTCAIHHPKRGEFNASNPNICKNTIEQVGCLPTDWTTQYKMLREFRNLDGTSKPIPTIWKRSIAEKLQNMTAYHASKYLHGTKTKSKTKMNAKTKTTDPQPTQSENEHKNHFLANLVDLIRITHPKQTDVITELVKTGKIVVSDDEQTWEKLRSAKKTWMEITQQIRLPHMALLRNLRNIIEEYAKREDVDKAVKDVELLTEQLVSGVRGGKQFPFRYFSAYKMLKSASVNSPDVTEYLCRHPSKKQKFTKPSVQLSFEQSELFRKMRAIVLEGLNRCVLESVESIPPMKGRVDCLSDNSGSSRGGIVSEYGTVNVYEIANLSAILTAYRATDGGSVWVFGDRLEEYVVTKKPILEQLEDVNTIGYRIGASTETGVWLFWAKCIREKKRLDTVFIYSDMQAGTGKLYVDETERPELNIMNASIETDGTYIDVLKLVQIYREKVYPRMNVFSVQVAGYDNSILPDILYRGAILSGWTGKETKLAYEMNELWDNIEM